MTRYLYHGGLTMDNFVNLAQGRVIEHIEADVKVEGTTVPMRVLIKLLGVPMWIGIDNDGFVNGVMRSPPL